MIGVQTVLTFYELDPPVGRIAVGEREREFLRMARLARCDWLCSRGSGDTRPRKAALAARGVLRGELGPGAHTDLLEDV